MKNKKIDRKGQRPAPTTPIIIMAPPQFTYKMRGETRADYRSAMAAWREDNLTVNEVSYENQMMVMGELNIPLPDFTLVIRSPATREQLIASLRRVTDLHVMHQTLQEEHLYTGVRNY